VPVAGLYHTVTIYYITYYIGHQRVVNVLTMVLRLYYYTVYCCRHCHWSYRKREDRMIDGRQLEGNSVQGFNYLYNL